MPPSDRDIRVGAALIATAGVAACALAILADALGVGTEGSGRRFGSSQISLLVASAVAVAVGVLLLARPQIVRRWIDWGPLRQNLGAVSPETGRATPAGTWANLVLVGRGTLPILMAIAIVINVVQFKRIDDDMAAKHYRAINANDTDNLFEIAISEISSTPYRVAPFHYLGELLPESEIVVPDGGVDTWYPFEPGVLAFGRATSVQQASYDPEGFLNLAAIDKYRIDTESFAPDDAFATSVIDRRASFYVNGEPSGVVLVLTPEGQPGPNGRIAFVDTSVLAAEQIPTPTVQ